MPKKGRDKIGKEKELNFRISDEVTILNLKLIPKFQSPASREGKSSKSDQMISESLLIIRHLLGKTPQRSKPRNKNRTFYFTHDPRNREELGFHKKTDDDGENNGNKWKSRETEKLEIGYFKNPNNNA